jgi:glycosyltransferase involved in cell wall biosynthesis
MEETAKKAPQISIGMPVYNGEQFIREALDSLLVQTFTDFELIISDNASTDGTEAICREYETRDKRIRYVRWALNRGAIANFNFVLNEAVGEYFMWAACDDIRSVDYLELNCHFLGRNPDYVASTCPTRYEDGSFDQKRMGDGTLEGRRSARISDFFGCWHANGRFYSLFRLDVLRKNLYIEHDFLGSDWSIVLDLVSKGKTKRLDQGYVVLGRSGFSNSGKILKHYRKNFIHYILPFFELIKSTIEICSFCSISVKFKVYINLLKLNMQAIKAAIIFHNKCKL